MTTQKKKYSNLRMSKLKMKIGDKLFMKNNKLNLKKKELERRELSLHCKNGKDKEAMKLLEEIKKIKLRLI